MPTTGLSAECSAELQGVRGKMLKMRAEVDAANDRADNLGKDLTETLEKLHQTEEERNALQRQTVNLNDQIYSQDGLLKDTSDRLAESDASREVFLNEVKGLNHRLNIMDAAEETYKQQLAAERDRAAQGETEAAEYKRNVARLQMDNEKLDQDVEMYRSNHLQMSQQLKEAEDRIAELTSSYNQIVIENRQMEHKSVSRHHHHEPRSLQAPPPQPPTPAPTQLAGEDVRQKDRQLQSQAKDLEEAISTLDHKESRIGKLENEVYVYQENYRLLTDQLREVQQVNNELRHQRHSGQAMGASSAADQLIDAREQNRALNDQLSESEKQNASWEVKAAETRAQMEQSERQLQDQKAAYGELYSQMNRTIKDLETSNDGCDF